MTPKEKALELRDKFIFSAFNFVEDYKHFKFKMLTQAKQCALIAAEELQKNAHNNYMDNYWQEVRKEIEKL